MITVQDQAAYNGVKPPTIWLWVAKGMFPKPTETESFGKKTRLGWKRLYKRGEEK